MAAMTTICSRPVRAELLSDTKDSSREDLLSVEEEVPEDGIRLQRLWEEEKALEIAGSGSLEVSPIASQAAEAVHTASEEDTVMPETSIDISENDIRTVIYRLRDMGSGSLKIYWRVRHEVDGYQIRYSTEETFKSGVKTASFTERNSITRHGLQNGINYYVGVRTFIYNSKGEKIYSPWSGTKSLMLTRTLEGTTLTSAVRKADGSISAKWEKGAEADGYQLGYADDPSFTDEKTASVKNRKKTVYTRNDFSTEKAYYIRIRTYKIAENGEKYFSEWSNAVTVS